MRERCQEFLGQRIDQKCGHVQTVVFYKTKESPNNCFSGRNSFSLEQEAILHKDLVSWQAHYDLSSEEGMTVRHTAGKLNGDT